MSFICIPLSKRGPIFSISTILRPDEYLSLILRSTLETLKFPIQRDFTSPNRISCVAIWTTKLEGIANPIPWYAPVLEKILELIPIKFPFSLIKAPPEFPGFIAASVWISWK